MFDTIIIGSGVAGISAALTLKLHKKDILLLGSKNLSAKIEKAEKIANYPGLSLISGRDFAAALAKQLSDSDISVTEGVASSVMPMGGSFGVAAGSEFYEAKSVIIASGAGAAPAVKGESELLGRGLSYCATCDGFLYGGKRLFVMCESKEQEHEVEYLASIASEITLFAKYKEVADIEHVTPVAGPLEAIEGDGRVSSVVCGGVSYPCDGAFLLRSSFAPSSLVSGIELDGSSVKVDREQASSIPGIIAAGDITGRPFQYAKAAGEGNVAAHSVIRYLDKLGKAK